jgi:hypothetical protein
MNIRVFLMTSALVFAASITVALATRAPSSDATLSTTDAVFVPKTRAASRAEGLIARVQPAFQGYLSAVAAGRPDTLSRYLTEEAVIEYPTQEPGMLLAVDGGGSCIESASREGKRFEISRIFPTADAITVFVEYKVTRDTAANEPAAKHLAMVEMREDRIALVRYLTEQCEARGLINGSEATLQAGNAYDARH